MSSHRHSSDTVSATNSIKEEHSDEQYDKNVRTNILNASLPFVIELGWSRDALVKGAESLGYPGVAHGLFPRGGAELVQFFYTDCNQKLATKLKQVIVALFKRL